MPDHQIQEKGASGVMENGGAEVQQRGHISTSFPLLMVLGSHSKGSFELQCGIRSNYFTISNKQSAGTLGRI
jgi:hypothetical protein